MTTPRSRGASSWNGAGSTSARTPSSSKVGSTRLCFAEASASATRTAVEEFVPIWRGCWGVKSTTRRITFAVDGASVVDVSTQFASTKVYVVPTDEELEIASQTASVADLIQVEKPRVVEEPIVEPSKDAAPAHRQRPVCGRRGCDRARGAGPDVRRDDGP